MAQISYRANLSSAIFPMTLARAGRSVIIPGPDQNFDRRVDPQGEQKDAGIPQVIYMENVLPTSNGYQSVGYKPVTNAVLPFIDMAIIELKLPGVTYPEILAFRVSGGTEVYRLFIDTWQLVTQVGAAVTVSSERAISYGIVKGIVYIFHDDALFTYSTNGTSGTISNITATILPLGAMTGAKGIVGSYNYLLFLAGTSSLTVYRSSTLSAVDFQPSLITGAGSEGITNTQGNGVMLRANPAGFLIYTDNNVISSEYTGNVRYPFRYTPVKDSVGVLYPWEVYSDVDESVQYLVNRSSTVQALDSKIARALAPEVSEYFERGISFDSFDYTLNTFTVLPIPTNQETFRIYNLNSRYLFISYKESTFDLLPGQYDAAFVYDLLLRRYGKIRKRHSHLVTMKEPFSNKLILGLINNFTRACFTWELNVNDSDAVDTKGVILLGKFQYVRSRDLCLDELSFESGQVLTSAGAPAPFPGNFTVRTYPTRNGKDFLPAETPYYRTDDSSAAVANYFCSTEGRNISVLVKGAFDLCSVDLTFHIGGEA